jgi:hypothetical protein
MADEMPENDEGDEGDEGKMVAMLTITKLCRVSSAPEKGRARARARIAA